jgi:hypothetical protein
MLIDDIGEGLDFERSEKLIKVIVGRGAKNLQILMSTNDRFVMNAVDLAFWRIVDRKGSRVKIWDEDNDAKRFGGFKYTGLSNFDFFASGAYH